MCWPAWWEVVSGQPFAEYLSEHIWQPLGMDNTRFLLDEPKPQALATVYTQDVDGALVPVMPDSDRDPRRGGSGTVSNAQDYLRFALALWNGGEYRGARILQPESVEQMRGLVLESGVLRSEGNRRPGLGTGPGGGSRRGRDPVSRPHWRLLVEWLLWHHVLYKPGYRAGRRGAVSE